eukprot:3125932-Amphidinium_carterae.1
MCVSKGRLREHETHLRPWEDQLQTHSIKPPNALHFVKFFTWHCCETSLHCTCKCRSHATSTECHDAISRSRMEESGRHSVSQSTHHQLFRLWK